MVYSAHFKVSRNHKLMRNRDCEDAQTTLMLVSKPLQYLIPGTRRSLAAQEKLHAAFRRYYSDPEKRNHPSVSALARSRMNVNLSHGVPLNEIGNSGLSLLFVATTNAIPTLYWAILYLFSNPAQVSELRAHLENSGIVSSTGEADGKRKLRIDHTKFNEKCPDLIAAYNETMRITNVQGGTRVVLEDTVLSSGSEDENAHRQGFLFMKGSLIMTPARIVHLSRDIWGDDAEIFRPSRWQQLTKKQKRAFIPFGGGKHLCPGRDFAFAEIVGTLAVLLLGFDVMGEDGDVVKLPSGWETKFGVGGPDHEGKALKIKIRRRPGWDDVIWEFGNGE